MSRTARVYLPGTLATLDQLREHGRVESPTAHAVTPALREWYTDADAEELEYAAYARAARDSLRLLSRHPDLPRRRVVIAADAPLTAADLPLGSSEVQLTGPVPLSAVVAIHVDGRTAEPDVAAAVDALAAADAGDHHAQLAVAAAEDHELEWYDVSELDRIE